MPDLCATQKKKNAGGNYEPAKSDELSRCHFYFVLSHLTKLTGRDVCQLLVAIVNSR